METISNDLVEPLHQVKYEQVAGKSYASEANDISETSKSPLSKTEISSAGGHVNARIGQPTKYPTRFKVTDFYTSWDVDHEYYPVPYTAPSVLKNSSDVSENGWAHPSDFKKVIFTESLKNKRPLRISKDGCPLNSEGRTGIEGRGGLGKWGPNIAADPIVSRINRETKQLEFLLITRKDNGELAIPGGMVDRGELIPQTLRRELKEETGVDRDFSEGKRIYQGYVDDPRNTDNAWMETTATHTHISADVAATIQPKAGSDAKKAQWVPLKPSLKLYASHGEFIKKVVAGFAEAINSDSDLSPEMEHFLEAKNFSEVAKLQISEFLK